MIENINIRTEGRLIFRDGNNQIYKVERIHNLITTAGKHWVLNRLIGASSATMNAMQMGRSSIIPTVTDTGVNDMICSLPVVIVDDVLNGKIIVTATIPQAMYSGEVFKEAAIILSNGDCFNHSTFPDFTKTPTGVDVEWDIIYS